MVDPLAYTIADACKAGGFGRTTAYELVAEGKLDARKIGGRTVILAESLRAYLASLPRADIRTGQSRSEPTGLPPEKNRAGQQRAETLGRRRAG